MQAQTQPKPPSVIPSKSQNPPLTLITDKTKVTDDFRYLVKEEVVSELNHLKEIIIKYEKPLKISRELLDDYSFWKYDSDLLLQLKNMTEDEYFADLHQRVAITATYAYSQGDIHTDPTTRKTAIEGGNPFSTKAYNVAQIVPKVAAAATVAVPGSSLMVAPLAAIPKGIKELTKFKHSFMDYEKKIKEEYLKALSSSKFREKFVYEILRWTQQNKRGTQDQLIDLQIKVVTYYYARMGENKESDNYTVDYTPSADLSKIFGIDESIFTILQKIKQKDPNFNAKVADMLDEVDGEFRFIQLKKDPIVTPEKLRELESAYKAAYDEYRYGLSRRGRGTSPDRRDLTDKENQYNEAKSKKERSEKVKSELLTELSKYYSDMKQSLVARNSQEGVVNVNTLAAMFDPKPEMNKFFSNWSSANCRDEVRSLSVEEYSLAKSMLLTDIERQEMGQVGFSDELSLDLSFKYVLGMLPSETQRKQVNDCARKGELTPEMIQLLSDLYNSKYNSLGKILEELDTVDVSDQVPTLKDLTSDDEKITEFVEKLTEFVRETNTQFVQQLVDFKAKRFEAVKFMEPSNRGTVLMVYENLNRLRKLIETQKNTLTSLLGELITKVCEENSKAVESSLGVLYKQLKSGFFNLSLNDGSINPLLISSGLIDDIITYIGFICYKSLDEGETIENRLNRAKTDIPFLLNGKDIETAEKHTDTYYQFDETIHTLWALSLVAMSINSGKLTTRIPYINPNRLLVYKYIEQVYNKFRGYGVPLEELKLETITKDLTTLLDELSYIDLGADTTIIDGDEAVQRDYKRDYEQLKDEKTHLSSFLSETVGTLDQEDQVDEKIAKIIEDSTNLFSDYTDFGDFIDKIEDIIGITVYENDYERVVALLEMLTELDADRVVVGGDDLHEPLLANQGPQEPQESIFDGLQIVGNPGFFQRVGQGISTTGSAIGTGLSGTRSAIGTGLSGTGRAIGRGATYTKGKVVDGATYTKDKADQANLAYKQARIDRLNNRTEERFKKLKIIILKLVLFLKLEQVAKQEADQARRQSSSQFGGYKGGPPCLTDFKFPNGTAIFDSGSDVSEDSFTQVVETSRAWYPVPEWSRILSDKVPDEKLLDDMCHYLYYSYWIGQFTTFLRPYKDRYDKLVQVGIKNFGLNARAWDRLKQSFSLSWFDRRMIYAGLKPLVPSVTGLAKELGDSKQTLVMSLNDSGNEELKKRVLIPAPLLEGKLNAFIELLKKEAEQKQQRKLEREESTTNQSSKKEKTKKDKRSKSKPKKGKDKTTTSKYTYQKRRITPIKQKIKTTKIKPSKEDIKKAQAVVAEEVKRIEDTQDRIIPAQPEDKPPESDESDESGYISRLLSYFSSKETTTPEESVLQAEPVDTPVIGTEYIPGNILDEARNELIQLRDSESKLSKMIQQDKLAHQAEKNRLLTMLTDKKREELASEKSKQQLDRVNQANLQFKEQTLDKYVKRQVSDLDRQKKLLMRQRIQEKKELDELKRRYLKGLHTELNKQLKPGKKSKETPRTLYKLTQDMSQRKKTQNPIIRELSETVESSYNYPIAVVGGSQKPKSRTVRKKRDQTYPIAHISQ